MAPAERTKTRSRYFKTTSRSSVRKTENAFLVVFPMQPAFNYIRSGQTKCNELTLEGSVYQLILIMRKKKGISINFAEDMLVLNVVSYLTTMPMFTKDNIYAAVRHSTSNIDEVAISCSS